MLRGKVFSLILLGVFALLMSNCVDIKDLTPTYIIKFDANGGSGNPVEQTVNYGVNQRLKSLEEIGFSAPSGLYFAGWSETSTGDVAYEDAQIVHNLTTLASITLYA